MGGKLFILALILFGCFIIFKAYRSSRKIRNHKHSLCCDECKIKDKCSEYNKNKSTNL